MDSVMDLARGKWRGLLLSLGMPEECLTNKHGPCPVCGGQDRFRFDDKEGRGTFFCSQCNPGDGMRLAQLFTKRTFGDLAREIEAKVTGIASSAPSENNTEMAGRSNFLGLWNMGSELTSNCLAGKYLKARGLVLPDPASVRFHPTCKDGSGGVHPAMLALVTDKSGVPVQLHRTFLDPSGARKAEIDKPRLFMKGPIAKGASVRLFPFQGGEIGIAEGIETAIAASILYDLPVWAALNASLLAGWVPPEGCRFVRIFADNDEHHVGREAARKLARRLSADRLQVKISMPSEVCADCNDVLLWRRAG